MRGVTREKGRDEEATDGEEELEGADEVVPLEIDGTLDLHLFRPDEVKELVPDYLDECVRLGISQVRIVHGKGRGVLRRVVQAALDRHPRVVHYELGGTGGGSWGATVVTLRLDPDQGGPD